MRLADESAVAMIYSQVLTMDPLTQLPTTETVELAVAPGVVKQVFLTFPAGLGGLVGVRVRRSNRVLWPTNPDAWFIADNFTFGFVENLELDDEPLSLILEGYNNDCIKPHSVYFHFAIVRERADLLSELLSTRPALPVGEGEVFE